MQPLSGKFATLSKVSDSNLFGIDPTYSESIRNLVRANVNQFEKSFKSETSIRMSLRFSTNVIWNLKKKLNFIYDSVAQVYQQKFSRCNKKSA